MIVNGTTSNALKVAPKAITAVGVPEKYRWWNVPRIPPERKIIVENNTLAVADFGFNRPKRTNKKAITTVANTSKNPSTHRCTTHHLQYSAIARFVCLPHISPAP